MPVEVIDLLSSPELPNTVLPRAHNKTGPATKALAYESPQNDWFNLSSDHVPLPPLLSTKAPTTYAKPKSNLDIATTSRNIDWLPPLSSDPTFPSPKPSNTFAKPASKPTQSKGLEKGANDFLFLSDDFDSSINFDDSFDFDAPAAKKRRISPLPKTGPSRATSPKTGLNKRSISNIESSTKIPGRRNTSAPLLKRANTNSKALELDPLVFTSSPDPIADADRRKKEMRKNLWEDLDDSDSLDLEPRMSKVRQKSPGGVVEAGHGNRPRSLPAITETSDIEFPDIDALPSKMAPRNPPKSSQTALAKYNAERAKDKKAQEKAQKIKDGAVAKEVEKDKKQSAKEDKAREKGKAAEMAKVNTLRTDKKISTPEMIVDLPSSLDSKLADQARTFLTGLQVEHFEWESLLPIIRWRRKVVAVYNEEMGHYEPVAPHIKKEKHVMYIMSAQEFVDLATGEEGKDLDVHLLRLKAKFESSEIIFLVQGFNAWMRKNRNVKNRHFTQAVRGQMNQEEATTASQRKKKKEAEYIDEDMIEDAMLRLQVMHGALIHHTAVMNETAEWIVVFTQHISTIPYRSQKQSLDTAFCMESGQVKAGDGVADTYAKMLQEIVRITAPVAYGIAAQYPTLRKLVEGLKENGPLALEDCKKSANKDGAFTDRRIGPAISKRVYKVFTGEDPSSLDV